MFLRRTHLCDAHQLSAPNDVANAKSGFPCCRKCTTDGVPIVVSLHSDDSDPGSAQ
jgi:hypothetical protein